MSMLCSVYRLNAEQSELLKQFPESIGDFLEWTQAPQRQGFLSRLFGTNRREGKPERRFDPLPEDSRFDLNQAWHVLHFLFTGKNEGGDFPASFILAGGEELGPDQGYGPPRYLAPALTKRVSGFLASLTLAALDQAYLVEEIEAAEIYWEAASESEDRQRQIEELWELTQNLSVFINNAAESKDALLVSIY